MKEFRFVGVHADELDGGRPLAPGDYTGPISERTPKNKSMIADGTLLPVEDGTFDRVEAINTAATAKAEMGEGALTDEEWQEAGDSVAALAKTTTETKKGDKA
jgi:hypothetical protein